MSVAGVDNNHDGQADDVNGDGVVDDSDKNVLPPTRLVRAHTPWACWCTWTFRNEGQYLGRQYDGESVPGVPAVLLLWGSTARFPISRTWPSAPATC